jgi:hypothetical protein
MARDRVGLGSWEELSEEEREKLVAMRIWESAVYDKYIEDRDAENERRSSKRDAKLQRQGGGRRQQRPDDEEVTTDNWDSSSGDDIVIEIVKHIVRWKLWNRWVAKDIDFYFFLHWYIVHNFTICAGVNEEISTSFILTECIRSPHIQSS